MLSRPLLLARAQTSSNVRSAHTQVETHVSAHNSKRSIAVLGAGLAGLTCALQLARHLGAGQSHRILLLDASPRVGGWVRSDRVFVNGKEGDPDDPATTALLEAGPRSLRPAGLPGLAMLNLIKSLGLSDDLICVPKTHPSAKNRFIYYAGRIHLLPSSLWGALKIFAFDRGHPLSKAKIPSSMLRSLFKSRRRDNEKRWSDESVESFLTRCFGKTGTSETTTLPLLDYVGSAVLHGIYATDASQLSVRTILGFLWNADLVHGSPIRAALPPYINSQHHSLESMARQDSDGNARFELLKASRMENELAELRSQLGEEYVKDMEKISVASFRGGIQTLTEAIRRHSEQNGVEIVLGAGVESVDMTGDGKIEIRTSTGVEHADRIVAAIPSSALQKVLRGIDLPHLSSNSASTVAVLNLAIPPSEAVHVPPGFGYLVPRACAKEGDNPLGLLGVVFDSSAVPGQDGCSKMTMMFGGPFFQPDYGVHEMLSNNKEAAFVDAALDLLSSHLNLDPEVLKRGNVMKRLSLQKDCIVTYAPDHLDRMAELDAALQKEKRITVIGASYTGVSINDCVLYPTRTVKRLVASERGDLGSVTGLEELVRE